MENKQKRITLKTIHQMLDGMSVDMAEKVHLLFMAFFRFSPLTIVDFCRDSAKHASMMAFAAPKVILLAKRGSTFPCIPSPQAREKLRISRIPHSQSSGIAGRRDECFYTMR